MEGSGPPSNTRFLRPSRVINPNGASSCSAAFVLLAAERPYTLQCGALPLKIAPSHDRTWTPISYMIPWAHRSPKPEWHLDCFSRFAQLTVERLYTFQWATLSPKIAPHHGGSGPHLIHDFLGQSELTVQTASRSFIRFRTGDRRVSVYVTIGRPFPHGRIWTPCNAWFLGPTRVLNPNGITTVSAVFAGLTTVTDRQTDSL